ncbi:MAG: hypothetical protein WCK29_02475, partial [archaeon]
MVYKKFANRDGKKYGPYMYENKRVGEKVVTNYLGKGVERKNSVSLLMFVLLSALIFIGLMVVFINAGPTGRVLMDVGSKYSPGDQVDGIIKFNLKAGELISKDSLIKVSLGGASREFPLSDLVNSQLNSGNFYSEGAIISGSGEGYGVPGTAEVSPTIYFDLRIIGSSSSSGSSSSGSSDNSSPTLAPSDSTPAPVPSIAVAETPSVSTESSSDSSSASVVTGNAVNSGDNIVTGKVSKGNDFGYA